MADPTLGPRWSDGPVLGAPGEARAIELLRGASAPPPLDEVARRRVLARLEKPRRSPAARPVLVGAALLLVAGIAAAFVGGRAPLRRDELVLRAPRVTPPSVITIEPLPSGGVAEGGPGRLPPEAAAPNEAPEPAAPTVEARTSPRAGSSAAEASSSVRATSSATSRATSSATSGATSSATSRAKAARAKAARDRRRAAAARAAVEPSESAFARETELFRAGLAKLRQESNPTAAMALFDRYDREYPAGSYAAEVEVGRVGALLDLGRRDAALERLRRQPLETLPRGHDLLVTRGELEAAAGRCAAARADFDRALGGALAGPRAERALYGRAVCSSRMGEGARAAADFRRYLEAFPSGSFAAEARAALRR